MMRKALNFIIFTLICLGGCGCAAGAPTKPSRQMSAQSIKEPNLRPVFSILIKSSKDRLYLGEKERIFVPFTLKVSGELKGVAMSHGVDIQKQNKDSSKNILAKYGLALDDGESIYVENAGIIRTNADGSRYFVTIPKFETYSPKYKWLEKRIFVGYANKTSNGTLLTFYELK